MRLPSIKRLFLPLQTFSTSLFRSLPLEGAFRLYFRSLLTAAYHLERNSIHGPVTYLALKKNLEERRIPH